MTFFNDGAEDRYNIGIYKVWFFWVWVFQSHRRPIFNAGGFTRTEKAAITKVQRSFERAYHSTRRN